MSDDADGYAIAQLGDALHEAEREIEELRAEVVRLREAVTAAEAETAAVRALLDPDVSFKDIEAHVRDGSLKSSIRLSEGSQPYGKFLAAMMWHFLMGEDGDESADGTEPDNYRTAEIAYQGVRCAMTVVKPGGRTPHQLREIAEAERDAARAALTALTDAADAVDSARYVDDDGTAIYCAIEALLAAVAAASDGAAEK